MKRLFRIETELELDIKAKPEQKDEHIEEIYTAIEDTIKNHIIDWNWEEIGEESDSSGKR